MSQETISIASSITPAVLVTWIILAVGFIANFVRFSTKVDTHHKILYNPNGEINVITAATFLQRQAACQKALNLEYTHLTERVDEMERKINALMATADLKDRVALNRILELRECVILLSSHMKNICNLTGGHIDHG